MKSLTILLTCLAVLMAASDVHAQVLHLVPSHFFAGTHQPFLDACLHIEQWRSVYARTTYLGSDDGLDSVDNLTLVQCFSQMNAHGLQLTLETGITGAFTTGQDAFNWNSGKWNRFVTLGAPLSALFIDEPLHNGTTFQHLSYGAIVDQTSTWIALVRHTFPRLRLILIEPYPAESSNLIINFVTDVNAAAGKKGVTGLDGLEIDHAWDGRNPWSGVDMADMRAAVESRRMEFGVIFYAAMPFENPTDDCDFQRRLYQQWDSYNANEIDHYGFYPDIYTVESWDQLPSVTVPEASGVCTFMQGTRQWLNTIDRVPPIRSGFPEWNRCRGLLACTEPAAQ